MADQAADFLHASGKLQALLYKEDIESALRTPGMGGFQLLDLHDFPGQGTALVGVLDAVLGLEGLRHRRRVPALLRARRCRSRGSTGASSRRPRRWRPTSRSRTSARAPLAGARPVLAARRRRRAGRRAGARCRRATCRSTTASRSGRVSVQLSRARRPAAVPARRRARGHAASRTTGTSGCTRRAWTRPCPPGVSVARELDEADGGAASRRRPRRPARPARPRARRRAREGGARLLEHLLEHGLDEPPGAAHARRPPRPEAPRARRVPDRGPQQLAVVVPREPRGGDDPRRPAAGAAAHGAGDRRLVHEPAARPRLRGAGGEGAAPRDEHRPRDATSRRTPSPARCATASCATPRATASRRRSRSPPTPSARSWRRRPWPVIPRSSIRVRQRGIRQPRASGRQVFEL